MTVRNLAPETFTAHRQLLDHPDAAAIRTAFDRLPRRASLAIRCGWAHRQEALTALETAGAFALHLHVQPGGDEVVITALKGKSGACFETGRTVTYNGAALAVMDDDQHLIVGAMRVCEKTGGVYTLPPYRGVLSVTDGEPDLIRRLDSAPVPFDCNTVVADAARLAGQPFAAPVAGEPMATVCYPGPFKLMVLKDGSILRRGACVAIPQRLVSDLVARDKLYCVPDRHASGAATPMSYPATYRTAGAGCLLEAVAAAVASPAAAAEAGEALPLTETGRAALKRCSRELRQRLQRLIAAQDPYFILSGSDPRDAGGCCPSTQVGEANRLVEAGALASYSAAAAPEACTTTTYALPGEIRLQGGHPSFVIQTVIRKEVGLLLAAGDRAMRRRHVLLGIGLGALVGTSVLLAGWRVLQAVKVGASPSDAAWVRWFPHESGRARFYVCLFHSRETCATCETLGRLCRQTLATHFADEVKTGRLTYREINYDAPENRSLKHALGLYDATVGLVACGGNPSPRLNLLTQGVWRVAQDDAIFVERLRQTIAVQLAEDRPAR